MTGSAQTNYALDLTNATGGTFTLSFQAPIQSGLYVSGGSPVKTITTVRTTASIAYNATGPTIRTALWNAGGKAQDFIVTGAANTIIKLSVAEQYPFVMSIGTGSLTGTATITPINLYISDAVHPSVVGQQVMAQAVVTLLSQLYPPNPLLSYVSANNADRETDYGMIFNSCFTYFATPGDPTGTLDSWGGLSSSANITYSYPSGSDVIGNWMKATANSSSSSYIFQFNTNAVTSGFNAGDIIAFSGKIKTSGFQAYNGTDNSAGAALPSYQLYIAFNPSTTKVYPIINFPYDISMGYFYCEASVPAGTTNFGPAAYIASPVSGISSVSLGQLAITNLTQLGLVNP
jgi:hypothetical protein